jgi:phage RecT family recombinase
MKELTIIKQEIAQSKKAFEAVLPKNFDVNKFMATLFLEVQKNPKLGECTNFLEIAKDVASFGLIIGGLANQAYLIPYNKKTQENGKWISKSIAQLIIGYKGYVVKLEESGYSIEVELVTNEEIEKGFFQEIRGSNPQIIHNPLRNCIRNKDSIALAYCILSKDGKQTFTVLSKQEIEEMAKTEKWIGEEGKKTKERQLGNVWQSKDRETDYGQMCIKTVIRNAVKKVNLNIANEMSTYEGNRDAEIINITPELKNEPIEVEQGIEIENLCKQKGIEIATICNAYKIDTIIHLPVSKFAQVIGTLNSKPDAVKEEVVNANN